MRSRLRLASSTLALVTLGAASCAQILGLDQFHDTACTPGAKEPCYEGDDATLGVGPCKAGTHTCAADGQSFGACVGQVLPAASEDCGNKLDDDCNGQVNDTCSCAPGEMVACYSGDPAKEGIGICHAGAQTCALDGSGFGACEGEQGPGAESCAAPEDEDCDGLDCVEWAKSYGDATNSQVISAVALDPSDGTVVIAGNFNGNIDIGGTTLSADTSSFNAWVARFLPDGTLVWAKSFVTDTAWAVTVDAGGNVYVGGGCAGTGSVGSFSLTKGQYLAKLDKSGNPLWAKTIGDSKVGLGFALYGLSSLAIAPDGDVLLAGYFQYPMDFGDGAIAAPGTGSVYVAKLNSADGTGTKATTGTRWTQVLTTGTVSVPNDGGGPKIGVDAKGTVYVGMTFAGTLVGGSLSLPSTGGKDIMIAGFDAMGNLAVTQALGGASDQVFASLAVDSFGGIVIGGQTQGTLTVPNTAGTLTATSTEGDGFIVSLVQQNGSVLYGWGKTFATAGIATDMAIDGGGKVRTLGWFAGDLDLGAGVLNGGVARSMVIAALDGTDGTTIWNRAWAYPTTTVYVHLAAAPAGDSFVGGLVSGGAFDLGTGPLFEPTDSTEAWVARFAP